MDLKRQYEMIKDEIDEAIQKTIDSCAFVAGEKVKEFENNFANYCNAKYAIGISNGTSAIYAALKALNIGKHDAVITTPLTFIATAEAISFAGATPIFVDINEDSYTLDPEKIKEYIEKKCEWIDKKGILRDQEKKLNVKAIIPVHLYGQPADLDPIISIAKKYNLAVVEDAAQAHGALYKDKKAGTIADLGAFSFYPSKNLGAYGQGGMVVTNNEELANKIRMIIDHGQKERYYHEFEGWNYKMDGFQASILNTKLGYLDDWNEDRRQNAYYYNELLNGLEKIITPKEMAYAKHVYHLYVVRVPNRENFQSFLKDNSVGTSIHYPMPLHLQKAYKHLGYKEGDFPISEKCAREIVSLPMFPELTRQEIEYACTIIRKWAGQT